MLEAMTHPSRVLNLDIKAEAFFKAKSYIYIYIYIYDEAHIYVMKPIRQKQYCLQVVIYNNIELGY